MASVANTDVQFNFTYNQSIAEISARILSTQQLPSPRNLSSTLEILLARVFVPSAGYRGGHSAIIFLSFGNASDSSNDLSSLNQSLTDNDIGFFYVAAAEVDKSQINAISHGSSPEFQIQLDSISPIPSFAYHDIVQATICNGLYCDANTTLDLVIVLDASSSFTLAEFNLSLLFFANVIEGLYVGPENTRFIF